MTRAERHAAILDGAEQAFAARGFAATSMERVASASGITKLIVYRHFASKQDLYRAVLDRTLSRLKTELADQARRGGQGQITRAVLCVARAHPDGLRLLVVHAAREPDFADLAAQLRARANEVVAARFATVADPALRRWMAHVVVSHLLESVLSWLDLGDAERDEEFAERCAAGLSAMISAWRALP